MFRGEDHLHSGGVGSSSSSADGDESSPYLVHEDGNVLKTTFSCTTPCRRIYYLRRNPSIDELPVQVGSRNTRFRLECVLNLLSLVLYVTLKLPFDIKTERVTFSLC